MAQQSSPGGMNTRFRPQTLKSDRQVLKTTILKIIAGDETPDQGNVIIRKDIKVSYLSQKEELNEELQPDEENFLGKGTIVVSQIEVKGPSQCAVPDQARLYLDRRLTWGENAELAIGQVKEKIGKALGMDPEDVNCVMPDYAKTGWKGTAYSQELYFPTWKTDEKHHLVQAGVTGYTNLYGKAPVGDKWTFSTNLVSVSGRHDIPGIGFGPGDEDQAHAPNEVNRVEDLVICSAFYAALVYSLDSKV